MAKAIITSLYVHCITGAQTLTLEKVFTMLRRFSASLSSLALWSLQNFQKWVAHLVLRLDAWTLRLQIIPSCHIQFSLQVDIRENETGYSASMFEELSGSDVVCGVVEDFGGRPKAAYKHRTKQQHVLYKLLPTSLVGILLL